MSITKLGFEMKGADNLSDLIISTRNVFSIKINSIMTNFSKKKLTKKIGYFQPLGLLGANKFFFLIFFVEISLSTLKF